VCSTLSAPYVLTPSRVAHPQRARGSPVSEDYPTTSNHFAGTVEWVQIDTGDLDPDLHSLEHQLHLDVAHGTQ
jgi:hypothetical protein